MVSPNHEKDKLYLFLTLSYSLLIASCMGLYTMYSDEQIEKEKLRQQLIHEVKISHEKTIVIEYQESIISKIKEQAMFFGKYKKEYCNENMPSMSN